MNAGRRAYTVLSSRRLAPAPRQVPPKLIMDAMIKGVPRICAVYEILPPGGGGGGGGGGGDTAAQGAGVPAAAAPGGGGGPGGDPTV